MVVVGLVLATMAVAEGCPGTNQADKLHIVAAFNVIAIRCHGKSFSVEDWMLTDVGVVVVLVAVIMDTLCSDELAKSAHYLPLRHSSLLVIVQITSQIRA